MFVKWSTKWSSEERFQADPRRQVIRVMSSVDLPWAVLAQEGWVDMQNDPWLKEQGAFPLGL